MFHATLKNFPNLVYIEAGSIDRTAAGTISVPDALDAIAGRPIVLGIGQEPTKGSEFESIRNHLALYPSHPHMTFTYTIMHMRKKDRSAIRDIHRCLDEYWEATIYPQLCGNSWASRVRALK